MGVDIGLVGAGGISHAHRPAFRDFEDRIRLTGVCDVDEERAADVAAEFDVEHWTDFETFVEDVDADAVDVALPHSLHYPAATAALEAGKHVFLEKPFATSMAECSDLVDLAEQEDRRLMIGMVQRYHPRHRAVKSLVDAGELGPIHTARIDMLQSLPEAGFPPDHWLYDGELAGGGGILSVLVHKIDLLRYFLGDARRAIGVSKTVHESFDDAEDYAVGLLEFENGTVADFFNTYSAAGRPYDELFWLFGGDGVVHTVPDDPHEEPYVDMPRPKVRYRGDGGSDKRFEPIDPTPTETGLPTDSAFTNELLHFADCVETGREPLSSGRDNLRTMATVFAIYESCRNDGAPAMVDDILQNHGGA
ncbi:Gfo/Idh/MocA family protein [Halomontanus rarus]|uniref:Gfo/Idh/MocA family protein n=1 Tax=Halomontanus rarus TaxID=3034020 RepID=UPI0023E76BE8|nr:Gfo/Idh/MocA family oxidoreductase [Halovivax sp. TS33]